MREAKRASVKVYRTLDGKPWWGEVVNRVGGIVHTRFYHAGSPNGAVVQMPLECQRQMVESVSDEVFEWAKDREWDAYLEEYSYRESLDPDALLTPEEIVMGEKVGLDVSTMIDVIVRVFFLTDEGTDLANAMASAMSTFGLLPNRPQVEGQVMCLGVLDQDGAHMMSVLVRLADMREVYHDSAS